MKLLSKGNTKIEKTNNFEFNPFNKAFRVVSLSMMPDSIICPYSKIADCYDDCLKSSGRGRFDNVANARQAKTDYWHRDRKGFLNHLRHELTNFNKLCERQNVQGVVRLNTISDIQWERFGIPQSFPKLFFYDYTKIPKRVMNDYCLPSNYKLIYSFSGNKDYFKHYAKVPNNVPLAVVFKGALPNWFNGKEVIDGDKSDLLNAFSDGKVVGLLAKGKAKNSTSPFAIDNTKYAFAIHHTYGDEHKFGLREIA